MRIHHQAGIVAAVLIAGTSPLAAQQAPTTIQQDFEAAIALAAKGDDTGALAAWQALEKRSPEKNRRNIAIIRVRMGAALYKLNRLDEALAAVRAGLADLPVSDATLNEIRFDAYYELGQIAGTGLDYASAVEAYRAAEPLAPDVVSRLVALRGLIGAETFVDPEGATTDLARADGVLASVKSDSESKAIFATLRSVLLLNQAKFAEARAAAGDAVTQLGGLTLKTDLYDVAARSDYAIAALLSGNYDDARKYMAATGAGRLPKGIFDPGVQMKVPDCGGDEGLRPNDAAVIEFSISDSGAVNSVVPIYAAGGGKAALAFARTVRGWSWTPEQVTQLPVFFRYRARVEMRCSTAFERPSIGEYLDAELSAWLAGKGLELAPTAKVADAAALPQQRAGLAAAEAKNGKDSLALIPQLYPIMSSSVVGREETNALAKRALAIADANGVTGTARVALARYVWGTERMDHWKRGAYLQTIRPALAEPIFASDPKARAAIRLILADSVRGEDQAAARQFLKEIAGDSALAANDPLRVGALVRTASMEAAEGKAEAARAAFEDSGLAARQCAIVDSAPRLVKTNVNSTDFPVEAIRWGFEGWTQTQHDVAADGRVFNVRAIVSYPPFVFTKAAIRMTGQFQYEKSYRPDGGLGCGGSSQRIKFVIP